MRNLMHTIYRLIPDGIFIKLKYWYHFRKLPNLKTPATFNEKLQWLKLHDRKPLYNTLVDKYEAKKYIQSIVGDKYIIHTLGLWDNFDDIEFEKLPDQFVLKTTHDSGGVIVCKDKTKINIRDMKTFIDNHLHMNYFYEGREWPYKDVKPRIIAEEYLEDTQSLDLKDYKVFVFNGKARMLFVASDRQDDFEETKFDFYDDNFEHLDIRNGHPNAEKSIEKPEKFQEMLDVAEKLAKDIPHLRVDFYIVNHKLYVGELTLSHWSGFIPFDPPEWDKTIGDWLDISSVK